MCVNSVLCVVNSVSSQQGPYLFIVVQLYNCSTQSSRITSFPSKEPSLATGYLSATSALFRLSSPFCSHFLKGSEIFQPDLRAILGSGRACAFLCLPPCCRLDIYLRPTSQKRTVSFASNLHPGKSFLPHFDAFRTNFYHKRARSGSSHAPSFHSSCSCIAAHFFQYIDRAFCTNIFLTSFGHTCISCQFLSQHRKASKPVHANAAIEHTNHESHTSLLEVL